MSENFEVVYTHPSGATATFIRHDGELDALAKALDAEQFWVFKNVKALLVRNEEGDLAESNRLMRQIGFTSAVRELVAPRAPVAVPEPVFAPAVEAHAGPHLPGPSYWPLVLAFFATLAFSGWLSNTLFLVIPILLIGMVGVFISAIGWGLEHI